EDDRNRKIDQNVRERKHQRIAESPPESRVAEKTFKISKSDPIGPERSHSRPETPECQNIAEERAVFEQHKMNERDNQHYVELPIAAEVSAAIGGRCPGGSLRRPQMVSRTGYVIHLLLVIKMC